MANYVFFGDTDCDITWEDVKKYNINLIYMPVYIDGQEYVIDLENKADFSDFYAALEAKRPATTAAINAQNYIEAWEPIFKQGKDVVYVAFSSGLSATFEQMKVAIKELEEKYKGRKVYYADTLSISAGGRRLVIEAAKMAQAGAKPQEIIDFINKKRDTQEVMFIVDDLNHLRRGGRVSASTAAFGTLLNMKPILHVKDGKLVKLVAKQGFKAGISFMVNEFKAKYEDDGTPIYILDAHNQAAAKELKNQILAVAPKANIVECIVGPIVAAHCGPKTVGIIYNKK